MKNEAQIAEEVGLKLWQAVNNSLNGKVGAELKPYDFQKIRDDIAKKYHYNYDQMERGLIWCIQKECLGQSSDGIWGVVLTKAYF
ncbi:hypothetical protein [Entomobacter blattae]|uniref:Uncharacterized protein n=1 Tax=Entomobacter blattae TaxID=2762277 RepID=A0A7H1NP53_9PROT|nr:hypothetical protein [Entomobacter blattae]QNT77563.1 hypothetical protein JGUZn3_03060 [Entomobacter blattae]